MFGSHFGMIFFCMSDGLVEMSDGFSDIHSLVAIFQLRQHHFCMLQARFSVHRQPLGISFFPFRLCFLRMFYSFYDMFVKHFFK